MLIKTELHSVLSISFEVDVPTRKVGGSVLFERRRRERASYGGLGACPPQKSLKIRCLKMLFSTFSRQYLCLLQAKAWDLVLWKCPRRSTTLWSPRSASTFYTSIERLTCLKLLKCALTWAGCFTIVFVGSFHYFKPVSCWILFSENVAGVSRPLWSISIAQNTFTFAKNFWNAPLFRLRRLRLMYHSYFCWIFSLL